MIDTATHEADYYGYRAKFAVLVPSTNTAVEQEFHLMRPSGVALATRGAVVAPIAVKTEEQFVQLVNAMSAATEQGLRDALTVKPTHVILGYSAETFWDGKARSDRDFTRYEGLVRELGGCGITWAARAIQDALALYPQARRIGVISPYPPVGSTRVARFLNDLGYEVVRMAGHNSPGAVEIAAESFARSLDLVHAVDGDDVDVILQVGTNLYFVELADRLDKELGKPVLAVNAVNFWHALRASGIPDRMAGYGRLLAEH